MPYCMVPGCSNDSKSTKGKGISYHRLPNDKKKSKIWLKNTKRKNPPKRDSCYVCSTHFEPQCFKLSYKSELTGQKEKKTLIPDAVPTIFKFNKAKRERIISAKREQNRQRKKVSYISYISKHIRLKGNYLSLRILKT